MASNGGIKSKEALTFGRVALGSIQGGIRFSRLMPHANILNHDLYSLVSCNFISLSYLGERDQWKEKLPEIADEINIVNLTSDEENKGMPDSYIIMRKNKDAESLALDVLTFLIGISSRDGKMFPVLRRAVARKLRLRLPIWFCRIRAPRPRTIPPSKCCRSPCRLLFPPLHWTSSIQTAVFSRWLALMKHGCSSM